MSSIWSFIVVIARRFVIVLSVLVSAISAQTSDSQASTLPVKSVAVFKDGHAFVSREGTLTVGEGGKVVLDELPEPVMGTFWPYVAGKDAKLREVVAGKAIREVQRTTLDVASMIEANVGAEVFMTVGGERLGGRIHSVPRRSSEELAATAPPGTLEQLSQRAGYFLLATAEGIRTVAFDLVMNLTFKKEPKMTATSQEFRAAMTLGIDGRKAGETVDVGYFFLQRGLRWYPQYRVVVDGKGEAEVTLQGAIQNDLVDLDGALVHLVVGVPSFFAQSLTDPMAAQQVLAQTAGAAANAYYNPLASNPYSNDPFGSNFSNAMMSQVMETRGGNRMPTDRSDSSDPSTSEIGDAERREDLFVFSVANVHLRRGERMTVTLATFKMRYTDIYTLDIAQSPPPDVQMSFNHNQQAEVARLLAAPKAIHKLRLENSGPFPMTTAPAIVMAEGQILGQGLMTYASVGRKVDLTVTSAIEVRVKRSERELRRIPDAQTRNGTNYTKVELAGTISLTNFSDRTIEIEVNRSVLGNVDAVENEGSHVQISLFEDFESNPLTARPVWWSWYSWPHWWSHFNGVGRLTWTLKIEPKKSVDLGYAWHYFWN